MNSPTKTVPLAPGSDDEPRIHQTTRAFFCGVVVEGAGEGELAQDVQELVASLGEPMPAQDLPFVPRSTSAPASTNSLASLASAPSSAPLSRSLSADSAVLTEVITELVTTERSYLKRLCMLKSSYADPLRSFAKTRDTSIIDAYAAKTLFGNVDQLIPVSEAFLADLELMLAGHGSGVGDVAIKHFRDLRAFDCYKQYYTKREEAQQIFEREMSKKSSTGFASYIDRIKYSTSDPKNRVGLRELLMEPVQRIPRYTLLFRTMIKHMPPSNPQRALLMEADAFASRIALAETDDPTRRAAVMHCLERSVESFPPGLISSTRILVDCIDVVDLVGDPYARGGMHSTSGRGKQVSNVGPDVLHATLFLFDDKLMICKRSSSTSVPGRTLAGLDETEKVAKVGLGLGLGFRKALGGGKTGGVAGGGLGLSCRGVVDVGDVVATDVGGTEMHMYLEDPPRDQPDSRWNGPSAHADPFSKPHLESSPEHAKARFLENLWAVQARLRTRLERSIALYGGEREVGPGTLARTWWNLYSRTAFLTETKKPKVVVHIDADGTADPVPFGMGGPGASGGPYVVIRVQPIAGELCRFVVSSCNEDDEKEEDIVHTPSVPGRIVQTIHQYGLFKFRTGHASAPGTPTRPRTALFSLDTLSFGSMTMANRRSRSRSVASRNSTLFSSVSGAGSASTGATSGSEDSTSMGRKFMKRSWSPGPGTALSVEGSLPMATVGSIGLGASGRSSPLKGRTLPDEDYDSRSWDDLGEAAGEMDVDGELEADENGAGIDPDTSGYDLAMRLELARKNSKTHQARSKPAREEFLELPQPLPTVYSRPSSPTKSQFDSDAATVSTARQLDSESASTSRQRSVERRPMGPRSPIPRSPDMRAVDIERARSPVDPERACSPFELERTRGTIERAKSPVEMERARIERAISAGPRPISPTGLGAALSPQIRAPVARKPVPRVASPPPDNTRSFSPPPSTVRAFSPPPTIRPLSPQSTGVRALSPTPGGPRARAVSPALVIRTTSLKTEPPSRAMSPIANRPGTPLAWTKDDSEQERPCTPPKSATVLRTERPGGTPMPVNARKRMPLESTVNTPPSTSVAAPTPKSPSVAPLSIQKKASLREAPTMTRKTMGSPKSKIPARSGSLVRVESKDNKPSGSAKPVVASTSTIPASEVSKKLAITAEATKEDLMSSRRAVKRIKIELDTVNSNMARPSSRLERVGSMVRSPQSRNIAGKIDSKFEGLPSIVNRRAMFEAMATSEASNKLTPTSSSDSVLSDGWSKTLEEVVAEAERHLMHAEAKQDHLIEQIKELQNAPTSIASSSTELEKLKGELQRARGQCELVKKLLSDATAENDIVYETFTEELDAMFADVNLREDQALVAMAEDLRKAKIARNDAVKENALLKRKLAEMEFEKQQ
ncbi:Formin-like protein 14 [Ceratobasidium sp. AG-Ba]|nr:Formin-like protein 14 [Ceratobasidium sp. AG-Ba]